MIAIFTMLKFLYCKNYINMKLNMKWFVLAILVLFIFSGCIKKENSLDVKIEFKEFPEKYTCMGENTSPEVGIEGINESVKSIAIILDDTDAPSGKFTHWLIWNIEPIEIIPERIPKEKEVKEPINAIQGKNDFGKIGYDGPCPPAGVHHYHFRVYGLDTMLDLKGGADRKALEDAMEGHIIQYGEAIATYKR